jgi:hypothetical protein
MEIYNAAHPDIAILVGVVLLSKYKILEIDAWHCRII